MTLKEFLEIKIIDTSNYELSVYNILAVVVTILITRFILGVIKRIFKRVVKKKRVDLGTANAIYQIIKYLAWILASLLILDSIGVKITILLASSAALMVGLGLGLQQIFQDFISGITLHLEGSLRVNDIIQTHEGDVGRVKSIGLRTSKIETRNSIIIIVPNSQLINESLINWSHMENTTRFNVNVGVAYGSDTNEVKKILLDCALQHNAVENDPLPLVFFEEFGDSSLNFKLLFYTNRTFDVESIKSDLRFSIDEAFRKNNITIPFPQRDLHIKK